MKRGWGLTFVFYADARRAGSHAAEVAQHLHDDE